MNRDSTNMVKKKHKSRIWWIGIHLSFTGSWIGTTLVLLILTLMTTSAMNIDVRLSIPSIVYSLDLHVMRITGIGTIMTGGVLAGTYWGFTRFYWVIAKELASVGLVVIGATWLEPIESKARNFVATQGVDAFKNPQFVMIHQELVWTLIGWLAVMISLIFISKLKPWGKTRS